MTREHLEATDPLKAALKRLTEIVSRVTHNPRRTHPGQPCVSYEHLPVSWHEELREAVVEARAALASSPEPEWEYRACSGDRCTIPLRSEAETRKPAAFGFGHNLFLVSRRRNADPGEWEALPDD